MPYIKKLNENKFISLCEEYCKINSIDDEYEWNSEHGISPACLQSICIKYKFHIMRMIYIINVSSKILEIEIILYYVIMQLMIINILFKIKINLNH